jgi:hypothetical protein
MQRTEVFIRPESNFTDNYSILVSDNNILGNPTMLKRNQPEWLKKALAERTRGPDIPDQITIIGMTPVGEGGQRSGLPMTGTIGGSDPLAMEYTGSGEDGVVQRDMPVEIVNTERGAETIHEGELKITLPDGTVRVLPSDQVPQELLQKIESTPPVEGTEQMQGMCGGGTYRRMAGMMNGGDYRMPGMAQGGNYKQVPPNALLYSSSTIGGAPRQQQAQPTAMPTTQQTKPLQVTTASSSADIVARMEQERERMTREGKMPEEINRQMTQILDSYKAESARYAPPAQQGEQYKMPGMMGGGSYRPALSAVAMNGQYKMPGMALGGSYTNVVDPTKTSTTSTPAPGTPVPQTQELAGLNTDQSTSVLKTAEGMVSGDASKPYSLANSESMAASAKNLRGIANNQISAAGLTGQGAATQVMQGVNQQIAGNLTQGLLKEAQDRQTMKERGVSAMQTIGKNIDTNRETQFGRAVDYGDDAMVGKTAANMFGQTIGRDASVYDMRDTETTQRQGQKDTVALNKFLQAAEYGDDNAVRAAYEAYFGQPLSADSSVNDIRNYAKSMRAADVQSATLTNKTAEDRLNNSEWQRALTAYDPNTLDGFKTLQDTWVRLFGGTAPDLNTIKSELAYAETKRGQDVVSGDIANEAAKIGVTAAQYDNLITLANQGVPFDQIPKDANGDGQPDFPNLTEEGYASIQAKYKQAITAGDIANQFSQEQLDQLRDNPKWDAYNQAIANKDYDTAASIYKEITGYEMDPQFMIAARNVAQFDALHDLIMSGASYYDVTSKGLLKDDAEGQATYRSLRGIYDLKTDAARIANETSQANLDIIRTEIGKAKETEAGNKFFGDIESLIATGYADHINSGAWRQDGVILDSMKNYWTASGETGEFNPQWDAGGNASNDAAVWADRQMQAASISQIDASINNAKNSDWWRGLDETTKGMYDTKVFPAMAGLALTGISTVSAGDDGSVTAYDINGEALFSVGSDGGISFAPAGEKYTIDEWKTLPINDKWSYFEKYNSLYPEITSKQDWVDMGMPHPVEKLVGIVDSQLPEIISKPEDMHLSDATPDVNSMLDELYSNIRSGVVVDGFKTDQMDIYLPGWVELNMGKTIRVDDKSYKIESYVPSTQAGERGRLILIDSQGIQYVIEGDVSTTQTEGQVKDEKAKDFIVNGFLLQIPQIVENVKEGNAGEAALNLITGGLFGLFKKNSGLVTTLRNLR